MNNWPKKPAGLVAYLSRSELTVAEFRSVLTHILARSVLDYEALEQLLCLPAVRTLPMPMLLVTASKHMREPSEEVLAQLFERAALHHDAQLLRVGWNGLVGTPRLSLCLRYALILCCNTRFAIGADLLLTLSQAHGYLLTDDAVDVCWRAAARGGWLPIVNHLLAAYPRVLASASTGAIDAIYASTTNVLERIADLNVLTTRHVVYAAQYARADCLRVLCERIRPSPDGVSAALVTYEVVNVKGREWRGDRVAATETWEALAASPQWLWPTADVVAAAWASGCEKDRERARAWLRRWEPSIPTKRLATIVLVADMPPLPCAADAGWWRPTNALYFGWNWRRVPLPTLSEITDVGSCCAFVREVAWVQRLPPLAAWVRGRQKRA